MEQQIPRIALLVMDMQAGILANYPKAKDLIAKVSKAIDIARARKLQVIYVTVGFRQGTPELSPNNKAFATTRERFTHTSPEAFMKIDADIAPKENDIHIIKRRFSAFTGSDLEVILRAQGIQHIVLTGISTSGVVLSTTREAADKDYHITILSDGCADPDEEVHRVLTTKVFPKQADVLTIDEWGKA